MTTKLGLKIFSVFALVFLVFLALGPCVMATAIGAWLGARPLHRLFRVHVDIFCSLGRDRS